MSCGICLEVVKDKPNYEDQTFGILGECMHCFCFSCIQQWRKNKEVSATASKSCPECRTPVRYVYRSRIWFDKIEQKVIFIANQKERMQNIHCKNYKFGKGHCPFGSKCMYRHSLFDDIYDDFEDEFDTESDTDKISVDESEELLNAILGEEYLAEDDTYEYWEPGDDF